MRARMRLIVVGLLLMLLTLAACTVPATPPNVAGQGAAGEDAVEQEEAGSEVADSVAPTPLAGSQWVLQLMQGEPPLPDTQITLNFEESNAGGTAGCNSYGGPYELGDAGALRFGEMTSTAMACIEPEGVMEQESAFLAALREVVGYELADAGERLLLLHADGHALLELGKQPTAEMDGAELVGSAWQLADIDGEPPLLPISLAFPSADVMIGHTGCRAYLFAYNVTPTMLSVPSQSMLGPVTCDEAAMQQEGTYTDIFSWASHYTVEGEQLVLASERGETLTFAPQPASELVGPEWQLVAWLDAPAAGTQEMIPRVSEPRKPITAQFDGAGGISGSTGCNSYNATYQQVDSQLIMQPPVSTRMMCEGDGIMAQEARFLQSLQNSSTMQLLGQHLWLTTTDGDTLFFQTLER